MGQVGKKLEELFWETTNSSELDETEKVQKDATKMMEDAMKE